MKKSHQPAAVYHLEKIAREYRQNHYQVTLAPDREQLPDTLADFQFDLLAVGPQENVVVEVTNRRGLAANRARPAMAAAVAALPGWRFELMSVGSEETPFEPLDDAWELPSEEIQCRVGKVRRIVEQEASETALLAAWPLAEAAMRVAARIYGLPVPGGSPLLIARDLCSAGVISQPELDWLKETRHGCRLLAHGYGWEKTDVCLVDQLLDFTQEMLGQDPAAA